MTIDLPPKTSISDVITIPTKCEHDVIKSKGETYFDTVNVKADYSDEINKIWERLNQTVSMVHNCQSCGATLEVEENKPIIHCKYCGNTYLVGAVRKRSTY